MDTILSLIETQLDDRLTIAALAFVAFVGIIAIGAWAALKD